MVTISIISHGHGEMISSLVNRLLQFSEVQRIIVTFNIPEIINLPNADRILVIQNSYPHGFGENHNQAFLLCDSEFFCVLNPDISFGENPFPLLIKSVLDNVALVAPIVENLDGEIEDSIRKFPSPFSILLRQLFGCRNDYCLSQGSANLYPEWVGGMFMLFKSSIYLKVGGFDESYYLYVEDVDICTRLWKIGSKVLACPSAVVFHEARRASRSNLQHFRWHFAGLLRYFFRYLGRFPKVG